MRMNCQSSLRKSRPSLGLWPERSRLIHLAFEERSRLLALQDFVHHDFTAIIDRDDLVDRSISAERNVDLIVSRIKHRIDRRILIQNALVDSHLRALGLCMDADCSLAFAATFAEQLLHFS